MMSLASFSRRETISLCRRAATVALRRLQQLRQWADPKDDPLKSLLDKLVRDQERQLADIARFDERDVEEGEDLDLAVAGYFPSLLRGLGGGVIDREAGSYFAECLEAEAAHFYRTLAEQASDEPSRAFFRKSEEAREARLRFVRTVLL